MKNSLKIMICLAFVTLLSSCFWEQTQEIIETNSWNTKVSSWTLSTWEILTWTTVIENKTENETPKIQNIPNDNSEKDSISEENLTIETPTKEEIKTAEQMEVEIENILNSLSETLENPL